MVNSGLCLVDKPSFLKLLLISKTRSKPPTNNLFKYSRYYKNDINAFIKLKEILDKYIHKENYDYDLEDGVWSNKKVLIFLSFPLK